MMIKRIQTFDKVTVFKVCESEMLLKNKFSDRDKDKDNTTTETEDKKRLHLKLRLKIKIC